MNFKNRKLFTLVELIIVIAIIGVLSVSAFTMVTKWLGKSRDSRRLGEINQIAKGLQSYFVENGKYPTPDMNYITLTSGANTIGYQGFVGSGVSRAIELNKITKDPMDEKYYTYTTNLQKYQLLAMLEGTGSMNLGYEGKEQGERINEYAQNNLSTFSLLPFNYVYSATDYSKRYPYLVGDKLGVILANTGGNTNAPVQELYSVTTFTGINVPTINTGIYTSYVDNTTILNGTGLLQMPIYTNESVVTPTTQESGGGGSSPANSCASTAWVSNATYSTGTPSTTNQVWQNSNSSNPCYFSCNGGYSWDGSACTQYEIANSLRFNGSNQYLTRAANLGDRKKFTYSFWVKRGNLLKLDTLLGAYNGTNEFGIQFAGISDYIEVFDFQSSTYTMRVKTTQAFRDTSSWYNIVVNIDTSKSSGQINIYVNGINQDLTYLKVPDLGLNTMMNFNGTTKIIGQGILGATYLDGYMSEVNFIDGQALGPENFGVNIGGKRLPKAYTGTYGTNGFYLDFKDSANFGKDVSGRNNNWTVNNHQVTDQMIDTPTNNFATLNSNDMGAGMSLINGGLVSKYGGGDNRVVRSTLPIPKTQKIYAEVKYTNDGGYGSMSWSTIGLINGASSLSNFQSTILGYDSTSWGYNPHISLGGRKINNGVSNSYGSIGNVGNIMMLAVDISSSKIWMGMDGSWFNGGNPVNTSDTNYMFNNLLSNIDLYFGYQSQNNNESTWNFGQGGQSGLNWCPNAGGYFKYCPPTGFKALSSKNIGN